MKRKRIPTHLKEAVLAEIKNGTPIAEAARNNNVAVHNAYNWASKKNKMKRRTAETVAGASFTIEPVVTASVSEMETLRKERDFFEQLSTWLMSKLS